MKRWKIFTYLTLLLTTPSLFSFPQPHMLYIVFHEANDQKKIETWIRPNTYDEIIQMLDHLESGELERRYSPSELERVNDYLVTLAMEGILPIGFDEESEFEQDVDDLLYGEDSAFQLTRYLASNDKYTLIPAVLDIHSDYSLVQCGKISRAWKKTKKFAKKHKKEIIIGAAVVVAVTVIAVAVVATSSACAATAAAGAASAASGARAPTLDSIETDSKNVGSEEKLSPTPIISRNTLESIDSGEAPLMKAAIDEHVSSFREFAAYDQADPSNRSISPTFTEMIREVGSNVAHQAYDELAELVMVVPQLCDEVRGLGSKYLPETLPTLNEKEWRSSIENYENLVSKGHEAIDKIFSTNQSELFLTTTVSDYPNNRFGASMVPLPSGIPTLFSNTRRLIEAGNIIDRSGFTRAGRGLMKHGYRRGSLFPKPKGNATQINIQGETFLKEILNDPKRTILKNNRGGIEIYSQSGRGAYFREDGTFRGFIEHGRKK